MRKIFLFIMLSADGYFEGTNHDLSWFLTDQEFIQFSDNQLDEVDTLVFGKRTFELMESYWPSDQVEKGDLPTAERMNKLKKIVFSHKTFDTSWQNTEIHTENVVDIIKQLRSEDSDKDIAILASSNLCTTLLREGIIDEIRLMACPVLIGSGTSLFDGLEQQVELTLTGTRQFKSGNVLNTYSVIR